METMAPVCAGAGGDVRPPVPMTSPGVLPSDVDGSSDVENMPTENTTNTKNGFAGEPLATRPDKTETPEKDFIGQPRGTPMSMPLSETCARDSDGAACLSTSGRTRKLCFAGGGGGGGGESLSASSVIAQLEGLSSALHAAATAGNQAGSAAAILSRLESVNLTSCGSDAELALITKGMPLLFALKLFALFALN